MILHYFRIQFKTRDTEFFPAPHLARARRRDLPGTDTRHGRLPRKGAPSYTNRSGKSKIRFRLKCRVSLPAGPERFRGPVAEHAGMRCGWRSGCIVERPEA